MKNLIKKLKHKYALKWIKKASISDPTDLIFNLIEKYLSKNNSRTSLEFLFNLQSKIDHFINQESVKIYNGKHPKHHLWKIHYQFILDNVNEGDTVFDVGTGASCSYIFELAQKCKKIDCCDNKEHLVEISRKNNVYDNVFFHKLDITKELPEEKYEVVIMSHILEHLEEPEKVLNNVKKITDKVIIRLPRYDNHWMYLVKKDLGMFYFKDADHKREYTLKEAIKFVESCGWQVEQALNETDVKILAKMIN